VNIRSGQKSGTWYKIKNVIPLINSFVCTQAQEELHTVSCAQKGDFKVILNYSVLAHSLRDGFLCTQSHLKHVLDERGQLRKKTSVLVYLIHTYALKMKAT